MLSLDERVAALEALLIAPAPLAVPPITVGELTNVPAPGSPIAAQWAQDVSSRVVQRFPTKAALDAWVPANGARGYTLDANVEYVRVSAGWARITPLFGWASGFPGIWSPSSTSQLTVEIPADPGPRVARVTLYLAITNSLTAGFDDYFWGLKGVDHLARRIAATDPVNHFASGTLVAQLTPGVAYTAWCALDRHGTGTTAQTTAPQFNRLEVTVNPSGTAMLPPSAPPVGV